MPLNSPIITGDVSGGLHSTSVDKLKGNAVAATAPSTGQTLVWDGAAWAPATPSSGGGGGANGLTYYLNQGIAADAPTTNIPGTPKQLGRTGETAQTSVTTGSLTVDTWTLVQGFVSESTPVDPSTTLIPAGIWDFNLWAFGNANVAAGTSIRAKAYVYSGTTLTLLGTSSSQVINGTSAQYSLSVLVSQTAVLVTDRIYIAIEAFATGNNHTVTAQFGDGTPSHVHTSLPLVGGTGLWHSVAGILQPNASLLVDADVDAAAAIAQSKIDGLTAALAAKAAQAQVDVYSTAGTVTWTKPANAKAVNIQLLGGGAGGAGGARNVTGAARVGGGGGGGGGFFQATVSASALGATETIVIGAGGNGGVGVTGTGAGSDGAAGSDSIFSVFRAVGGTRGNASGVAGNGLQLSNNGGAASGTGTAGAVGVPTSQASSFLPGGAGGGGGGGLTLAGAVSSGGAGGRSNILNLVGGAQGTTGVAGGAGLANLTPALFAVGSGGGGGGSSVAGVGGAGGAGGFPAGGGGGGGATESGTTSGAGGAGGRGLAIITTYF